MGRWLRMVALALASAVPLIGMAQEKVDIPSRTPSTWTEYAHGQGAVVTVVGYLYLPSGAKGPVPAWAAPGASALRHLAQWVFPAERPVKEITEMSSCLPITAPQRVA